MKKRMKYIIVCIIVILLCFIYAHIDKANKIYDPGTDNSSYVTTNVESEPSVSQSFKCEENELDGVALKVATNTILKTDTTFKDGKLNCLLLDANGKQILQGNIPISDIKSGRINKIKFGKTVSKCKGNSYTISFYTSGLKEGESVQLYYEPQKSKTGKFEINKQTVDGTLILRSLTHRFDFETFIVTLGFFIYFVVFFRMLYKLFS